MFEKNKGAVVSRVTSLNEENPTAKWVIDEEKYGSTKRGLEGFHVSLMIIGQTIGTGLFVGLGGPLVTSGPLSLLLGFVGWSVICILPLMFAVAVFATYLPVPGCFIQLSSRIVDPAFGFAVNIIYTYTCMMFVGLEATGVAGVIQYWTDTNPAAWISVCLVLYFILNIWGVRIYGHLEASISFLKVVLIVGLMLFALISMCGGNPQHRRYGFELWHQGGLMRSFLVDGATGRFLGFWKVMIYAAFACGGPDQLGLLPGEVTRPRKIVPSAARSTYIRVCIFYFGGIFFMCTLCSSTNQKLLDAQAGGSSGALGSPWVIGIQLVGVRGLNHVVNAGIMTSAFSCGNAFLYGATRSLYGAAISGFAPKIFSKCTKNGTPIFSLLASLAVGCLAFLSCSNSTAQVFDWMVNLSTTGLLLTYMSLWVIYFKFTNAVAVQYAPVGSSEYHYYAGPRWLKRWVCYFSFFVMFLILFFNGFYIFFPGRFTVADLFTSYFAPIFYIVLYVFWKIWKRTKIISPEEADITTGKQEVDELDQYYADIEEARALKQPSTNVTWLSILREKFTHAC